MFPVGRSDRFKKGYGTLPAANNSIYRSSAVDSQFFVDLERRCLIDTRNGTRVVAESSLCPLHLNLLSIPPSAGDPFARLLGYLLSLRSPYTSDAHIRHGVFHYTVTESRPVIARPRRLSPGKLVAAKAEFMSPTWASSRTAPLHMVPKGNGE